jgi:hypothetical protein
MSTKFRVDQHPTFAVRTWPSAGELGEALENNFRVKGALLQLHFGDQVARLPISDLWSACCELLFEADLVREGRLDHFIVDVEQIFDIAYDGDLIFCIFSREHVFAVPREQFAVSLECAVDEIFAATHCPRLMHIAARWGASAIRAQPYSHRFSESVLT